MEPTVEDKQVEYSSPPKATNATSDGAVDEDASVARITSLPAPIGCVLVAAGVLAFPFPGPFGTPLIIAGGLILAPGTFKKVHAYLGQRYPRATRHGISVIDRLLDDMERRFPTATQQ